MRPRAVRFQAPIAITAIALGLLILLVPQAPAVYAQTGGLGVGILAVDGSFSENLTLPDGGAYYLTIAPDASSFVNASLAYNGTVLAQDNRSLGASTQVSLPAGNYSLSLLGHGRAALGWDFTNGSFQEFPDNHSLVAFLVPSGPPLHVNVAMGDAQALSLRVYDDELREAGNASVTASGTIDFALPSLSDSIAYLVATVTAGNANGRFGLSWTSEPANVPINLTAWPWFLLWILVPVAVAFAVFALLHRRGPRSGPR